MPTITYSSTLVTTSCWCGIHLAVPDDLYSYAQRKGHAIYCPLGHTFIFTDTTVKRLEEAEKRLAEERRRTQATRELLRAEERSHSATRGHLTRTKKRVGNGICPCCNRSFEDLARHMASKHPTYKESHA